MGWVTEVIREGYGFCIHAMRGRGGIWFLYTCTVGAGRDMVFVYMHCGGGCLYLGIVWSWFGATLSGRVVRCWCPGAGVCALTLRCLHFGVLTPKF